MAIKKVVKSARKAKTKQSATATEAKKKTTKLTPKKTTTKKAASKKITTKTSPEKKASVKTKGVSKKIKAISEKQTSVQIIADISETTGIDRKDVKAVFLEMHNVIEAHLMSRGSGEVPIPELGIKIKRHEKPATKARMGRNPATGEAVRIAAKPKKKVVKVQALKKLKEIITKK